MAKKVFSLKDSREYVDGVCEGREGCCELLQIRGATKGRRT